MMKDDIFIESLPTIDVHGENMDSIVFILDSFIKDNLKLKNNKIVIIHGKGTGILRKRIHELLKYDKRIFTYYTGLFNEGLTVIELKLDK